MARFTASIDDNLKAQLDTYAEKHGYNRSEALEVMIRAFFEQKADAPQLAPTPLPETPSSPTPSIQPSSARLDELEKRVEQLQTQQRVRTPSNVRLELMELQTLMREMQVYLFLQHGYVEQLHESVVGNSESCVEGFTELGVSLNFFEPSIKPPEWRISTSE